MHTVATPIRMTTDIESLRGMDTAALYRLMTWLSPAFPVGAFSYSSGIEWAVEAGDVIDEAGLQDWLGALLAQGAGVCDGVLLAHAHRAAVASDRLALLSVAEFAAALTPSRERNFETLAQGRAFVDIVRAAWSNAAVEEMTSNLDEPLAYPVAVGMACGAHGIAIKATMHAFLHAVVSNWISAGARLIPLGQTACQRLLVALEPDVQATAVRAQSATLDEIGSATFRADLASMRHETQYTRLFRT